MGPGEHVNVEAGTRRDLRRCTNAIVATRGPLQAISELTSSVCKASETSCQSEKKCQTSSSSSRQHLFSKGVQLLVVQAGIMSRSRRFASHGGRRVDGI